jgi:hypothetical protein
MPSVTLTPIEGTMRLSPLDLALAALALTAAASPAAAQTAGPGADGDGIPQRPPGGMHGRRGMPAPDPVLSSGPPAPADFARIVELPQDRLESYSRLYDRYMTATRPQRDSLQTLRSGMRDAFASHDREAMGRQRSVMAPIASDLEHQQAAFDETLHGMLDQAQWKRYQQWRSDQRKQAEQERRDRWQRRSG